MILPSYPLFLSSPWTLTFSHLSLLSLLHKPQWMCRLLSLFSTHLPRAQFIFCSFFFAPAPSVSYTSIPQPLSQPIIDNFLSMARSTPATLFCWFVCHMEAPLAVLQLDLLLPSLSVPTWSEWRKAWRGDLGFPCCCTRLDIVLNPRGNDFTLVEVKGRYGRIAAEVRRGSQLGASDCYTGVLITALQALSCGASSPRL